MARLIRFERDVSYIYRELAYRVTYVGQYDTGPAFALEYRNLDKFPDSDQLARFDDKAQDQFFLIHARWEREEATEFHA